jgi:O-antigen/teichoic acid export membrane protein
MRRAARNFGLNLIGQVVPMMVAIIALPRIATSVGDSRLGFLGLTWALIGYFGLFDFGLSRVVTRRVAIAQGRGLLAEERAVVTFICWRAFLLVSLAAALFTIGIQPAWLLGQNVDPLLLEEATVALPILWATLPVTVVTGLLRGVLDGQQRFEEVNLLRIVFGTWSFAAPLLILTFSHGLPALAAAVASGRIVGFFAHAALAYRSLPKGRAVPNKPAIVPLLREGGWLTVSNVIGPFMVTFDRFVIAGAVSLAAAAHYFVPQEAALRLLLIPAAMAATIFPVLARGHAEGLNVRRTSQGALLAAALISLPFCIVLAAASGPLLKIWMGPRFAIESATVGAILAIGLFGNCVAQIPFASIQAAGRADATAKLHLVELPLYIVALTFLTWRFGIIGAAWCWTARTLIDAFALLIITKRVFPGAPLGRGLLAFAEGATLVTVFASAQLLTTGWAQGLTYVIAATYAVAASGLWTRHLRAIN